MAANLDPFGYGSVSEMAGIVTPVTVREDVKCGVSAPTGSIGADLPELKQVGKRFPSLRRAAS